MPNSARLEPLLWLQLLAFGVLPLELLLILLLLAGADPGPFPALERLFAWGLGCLAPAVLLWKRPPDVWSLLLLQAPLRGRREGQRRLSRLQTPQLLKVLALGWAAAGLPLLWVLDRWAALAGPQALLPTSPRLLDLLLAAGVLAVLVWQGHQVLQALWLLSRPPEAIAAAMPMDAGEMDSSRLSLGLPLLLLPSLQAEPKATSRARPGSVGDASDHGDTAERAAAMPTAAKPTAAVSTPGAPTSPEPPPTTAGGTNRTEDASAAAADAVEGADASEGTLQAADADGPTAAAGNAETAAGTDTAASTDAAANAGVAAEHPGSPATEADPPLWEPDAPDPPSGDHDGEES